MSQDPSARGGKPVTARQMARMGAVQSVWGFGFGALLGFFLVVSDTASQTVSLILGCAACLFFQGAAGLVLYAAFRVGRRAKAAASAIAVEPSPAD